jgi:hypothetical protein
MVDGNDCTGEWQKTGDTGKEWEEREPFQIGTLNLKFEKAGAFSGCMAGKGVRDTEFVCVARKGVTGVFRLREKLVGRRNAYRKQRANHKATVPRKLPGVEENRH